ncbi:hypothetical protein [Streptomyces yaizuensis]|uniref:Hydroxyisourate hydrolase n=1 Tax=Streptomyces yaizuensis TaxID=2989713 RepID=A0ABQ5NWC6_9ACTN|nr:hypothetical protein [Streptomyces sp. YSPA8]GLF94675.1 hydroxyisourate hydrolase [Streptomyces sp. YSPA8]
MRMRLPNRPGPGLTSIACATALLAGVLTTPSLAAPAATEGTPAPQPPAAEPAMKTFDPALKAAAEEAVEAEAAARKELDGLKAAAAKAEEEARTARARAVTAAAEAAVKRKAAEATGGVAGAAARAEAAAAEARAASLDKAADSAAAKAASARKALADGQTAVAVATAKTMKARAEAEAATSCPSAVPAYVLTARKSANGAPAGSTITRHVDWDPQNTEYGHIFDTEESGELGTGVVAFSGGGTRLLTVDGAEGGTVLRSYRDRTAQGGGLLTPEYGFPGETHAVWNGARNMWADAQGRIVRIDASGTLNVLVVERQKGSTTQAKLTRAAQLPATDAELTELNRSTRVWAAGDTVYGLLDGTIRSWAYAVKDGSVTLTPAGSTVRTDLTDVADMWSPAPGVVHVAAESGIVRKYAHSPLRVVDGDIASDISDAFAGTAACLSPADENEAPYFGTKPEVTEDPVVEPTAPEPEPDPTGPARVSGRFTLGDGSPAAGLDVDITAVVPTGTEGENLQDPRLGTVTTGADGTWSLTLPEKLPVDVQTAADANSGALNVTATTVGRTPSGVAMVGVDHLTAAPPEPQTGKASRFAMLASEPDGHSTELVPLLDENAPENNLPEPTTEEQARSDAARSENETVQENSPAPRWQNDRGPSEIGFNPFLVKGRDVSSEKVARYGGACHWTYTNGKKHHAYTTVGEAHAGWDSKATFEYERKVSNKIDSAISTNGKWKLSGGITVGTSSSALSGYTAKGPHFAKEWRIPIQYQERTHYYICAPGGTRSKYKELRAVKYSVPSGWKTGTYGKDVRHFDGAKAYDNSKKAYRAVVEKGSYFGLSRGKSMEWKKAASVAGISLGSTLTYDTNHTQKITAGNKKGVHRIWGRSDKVTGKPGVFYSR